VQLWFSFIIAETFRETGFRKNKSTRGEMLENRYFSTAIVGMASLGYIAGGALWYFDISDQPLSYVFVLPALIILFGIGIAYVGFKIIENHCQSEKKPTTKK
jgi:hypothetical protein